MYFTEYVQQSCPNQDRTHVETICMQLPEENCLSEPAKYSDDVDDVIVSTATKTATYLYSVLLSILCTYVYHL